MLPRKSAFDILMNRTNRPKEESSQSKEKTPNSVEASTSNHSDKANSENDIILLTDANTESPISIKSSVSSCSIANSEKNEPTQRFDPCLLQHMHQYSSKYHKNKKLLTVSFYFPCNKL
jgi:hypothetical protein